MRPDRIVVFLGPSLAVADARRVLEARYLAPVRCGDVLRARQMKPRVVAIIDGVFETTAAVWHKEILLAIEDGITVLGASSMGALRAAELAPFGMVGVGKIFESYRDGVCTDDDEVAVLHGDASGGYRVLSDAMVNIRTTVARAVECGVIDGASGAQVVACAKATFYQDRSLAAAMKLAWDSGPSAERDRFRRFLEHGGYVDQKRLDALALLHRLAGSPSTSAPAPSVAWRVHRTTFVARLQRDVMSRPVVTAGEGLRTTEERVALEARLLGPMYRLLRRLARLMSIAEALARGRGITVTPRARRHVFERGDFGLGPEGKTRRWARVHDLDTAAHRCLVERLATVGALLETSDRGPRRQRPPAIGHEHFLLLLLRIDGRYAHWRPTGARSGREAERGVLRNIERSGGEEFRLYRRAAKLWGLLDEAARRCGLAAPEDLQVLSDEFRRARDLMDAGRAREWLRANDLDLHRFGALVAADARLSLILDGSATSALRFQETMEPVCWLLDAIRLGGFYPGLERRLATARAGDRRDQRQFAQLLRDHCARLGEPIPGNIEDYARSLDFSGGEPELRAALAMNGRPPAAASSSRSARVAPGDPTDWDELRARRLLVRPGCRDTDGRPLAERNLEDTAPRASLDLRQCPYPGSRFQHLHPMNVSALRQLAEHWPDVIRAAAYLRQLHLQRYPRGALGLRDVYWISSTLAHVANYLLRRAVDPLPDDGIPAPIASLYKASLGVSGIAYAMCVSRWSGNGHEPREIDSETILAYAERRKALIGEAEVCAGPPDLILRFLEVIVTGDSQEASRAEWTRDLLPAPDRCLEYATAMVKMSLVRQLSAVRHLVVLDVLEARLARSLPSMAKRFRTWRGQREPWASLDRSPDHETTRWIAGQDGGTRDRIVAGIRDLIGQLDTAGASRVPPAFFRALRCRTLRAGSGQLARASSHSSVPRRHRAWLAAILSHQITLSRLHGNALHALAIEQAIALGRAGELPGRPATCGWDAPGAPAWEFVARELGVTLTPTALSRPSAGGRDEESGAHSLSSADKYQKARGARPDQGGDPGRDQGPGLQALHRRDQLHHQV